MSDLRRFLELLLPLVFICVGVNRGHIAGTETPDAESVAGVRNLQVDIPKWSGFEKQPFRTSTGGNADVWMKGPLLEADALCHH